MVGDDSHSLSPWCEGQGRILERKMQAVWSLGIDCKGGNDEQDDKVDDNEEDDEVLTMLPPCVAARVSWLVNLVCGINLKAVVPDDW